MQNQISPESRQVERKGSSLNSEKQGSEVRTRPPGSPHSSGSPRLVEAGPSPRLRLLSSPYATQVCSGTHGQRSPPRLGASFQSRRVETPSSRTLGGSPVPAGQAHPQPGVQVLPLPSCGPLVPVTPNSSLSQTGPSLPQVHLPHRPSTCPALSSSRPCLDPASSRKLP